MGLVSARAKNRILRALPPQAYARLNLRMKHVDLSLGEVLHDAGDLARFVYFPLSGVVSLLSTTEAGEVVLTDLVPFTGVFAPLADRNCFAEVTIDRDIGTVVWPSGRRV